MKINKEIYSKKAVVKKYSAENFIFPQEVFLINKLEELATKEITFIDLGVGAGRTTNYFYKYCHKYIGVDYSESMIKECVNKFKDAKHCSFLCLDACNMDSIMDNSSDITLFSFNGIDYVNLNKRRKILKEIKRITKKGGTFLFSTHNSNSISSLLKLNLPKNPLKILSSLYKYFGIRFYNDLKSMSKKNHFIQIADGDSNNFSYRTAYINPIFQIKMLEEIGFKDIKVVLNEIETTRDQEIIEKLNNPWLHFICKIEK